MLDHCDDFNHDAKVGTKKEAHQLRSGYVAGAPPVQLPVV